MNTFFEESCGKLIQGDSFKILNELDESSVDLIFADPPYFLSSNGISNSGGKMVSVNKGEWDVPLSVEEKHLFNREWLRLCKRVMKDNATIWISGTLHNIYSVGMALEEEGFKILNNITWQKTNPPPNLGCRNFTHSTETLLWAKKDLKKAKHFFNYERMKYLNNEKQMKDVWTGSLTSPQEKVFGAHPTQKPLYILERVIESTSKENDVVLDPFLGSGTTAVASKKLNRKYIGIEKDSNYLSIAKKRLEHTYTQLSLF
ncbi:site-specific DNA-methyltransferase [Staphylococcus simulans]|uniref:DNA-methyltransferase n=1 Tax=Staphylococcus simulans TaxID=1286 RepID=UPI001E3192B5|nr:site-specific DNA-methyltransferase [Staphylococcus simulans]MCD8916256.1 site-specific DNA-methyltransferase [Staphylococcus simulans]